MTTPSWISPIILSTPENNFPLNSQSTTIQPYSQDNYTYSSSSTSHPLNSYAYSTNLPISFSNATPYYSNAIVQPNNYNFPLDQSPYSLPLTYLVNSSSFATSYNNITTSSTMNFSSSDNRQEESELYYYV
jgi:hypothetical protein